MVNPISCFTGLNATPECNREKEKQLNSIPCGTHYSLSTQLPTENVTLIEEYAIDAEKILKRYPHGFVEEDCVNLSGLELKHLPPQFFTGCTNLRELNLSGNNIHFLPAELQKTQVELLNISGNQRLQPNLGMFSWLLEMPGLFLIANDMGFTFVPSTPHNKS